MASIEVVFWPILLSLKQPAIIQTRFFFVLEHSQQHQGFWQACGAFCSIPPLNSTDPHIQLPGGGQEKSGLLEQRVLTVEEGTSYHFSVLSIYFFSVEQEVQPLLIFKCLLLLYKGLAVTAKMIVMLMALETMKPLLSDQQAKLIHVGVVMQVIQPRGCPNQLVCYFDS